MAKIPIVSVYDQDGNRIEVPAIVGRSAYQSAQKLGYTGSEEEWIESLRGKDGRGIKSIVRTEGDGTPGTTDTYTITYTDNESDTFTVHNGINKAFVEEKFDQLSEGITGHGVWYGVTKTADYVNPKIVTTTTGDFKLAAGARIGVKFIYGNTGAQSINVDGTGDVLMVASNNEAGTYSTDTPVTYKPVGQILWMTYDGEYFVIDDTVRATEDTVGKVTISDSVTKTSSTTAASSTAVKAAYDKAVEALEKSGSGGSVQVDETLSKAGYAADAKETGSRLTDLSNAIVDHAVWYGESPTDKTQPTKIVNTTTGDFKLQNGARILVKFLANTGMGNSLNVDGTGAVYVHAIHNDDEELEPEVIPTMWNNIGQIQAFTYDGMYFIADDCIRATADNGLFGKVGVSNSVTSDSGDSVASSKAVKTAYDKAVEVGNNTYNKTQIDTLMGSYITDIDALVGGEE